MNKKENFSREESIRLCEIAYITGAKNERERINNPDYIEIGQDNDMNEMFDLVYEPILNSWQDINNTLFKSEEEKGYITCYANRIIDEQIKEYNEDNEQSK